MIVFERDFFYQNKNEKKNCNIELKEFSFNKKKIDSKSIEKYSWDYTEKKKIRRRKKGFARCALILINRNQFP